MGRATSSGREPHLGAPVGLGPGEAIDVLVDGGLVPTGNIVRQDELNCGLIAPGRAADFVFMDRAQHTAGATLLESVALGDAPGVGLVVIDGSGLGRNTPPGEPGARSEGSR